MAISSYHSIFLPPPLHNFNLINSLLKMMNGFNISKLGLLLTCLFSLFFFALLVEILFLLLSRHRHSTSDDPPPSPNRVHFLHSFLKRQKSPGRVEPAGAPATDPPPAEELMKMEYYSRLLFTIQEEEREGLECYSSERSPVLEDRCRRSTLNTDEAAGAGVSETPFQTPCASPLDYYTPSASPHG